MSETSNEPQTVIDPSTLNRGDLVAYALSNFDLTFKASATKAEMLAKIAEAQGPKAKYRAKRRLRHDGVPYGIGAIVTLSEFAAAPLLRTQVIEVATETVPL